MSFFIKVCAEEYNNLIDKNSKEQMNYIESISHLTAKNKIVNYDFDKEFYKYPSYLRRATIMEALGICASHFSRVKNYEDEKAKAKEKSKKFFKKAPTLNYNPKPSRFFIKEICGKKLATEAEKSKFLKIRIGFGLILNIQ